MATLMYGLVIRPQRRRMAQQRALLSSVKVGDRIVTTSGLFAVITAESGDVVTVTVAPGVDLHLARGAVARKLDASMTEAPTVAQLVGPQRVIELDALHAAEAAAEPVESSQASAIAAASVPPKRRGFGARGPRA